MQGKPYISFDPQKEAERAAKISASRKRRMAELGYINSPETRAKISAAQTGRKQSSEHRANISASLKGRRPANFEAMLAKGHATPKPTGAANHAWKGDDVGYQGVHLWVRNQLGRPALCSECGTTTAKRFEWANISMEYMRDLTDWRRLCVSCHRKEGFARGEYKPRRSTPAP